MEVVGGFARHRKVPPFGFEDLRVREPADTDVMLVGSSLRVRKESAAIVPELANLAIVPTFEHGAA